MDKTVLCYIEKDNKYLILYRNKKEHDINKDKYIGIGGHVENGESIDDALLRETKEETGLNLINYEYFGLVNFEADDYAEEMYLFKSTAFSGDIIECDEGTLMWIDKNELLSKNLWEGDIYFLDLMNKGIKDFVITLRYKDNKLIEYKRSK